MGMPAARVSDMHVCPMVTGIVPHVGGPILPPCAVTVLTGGLPQARIGDMATCVGPPDVIVVGAFTVLVSGSPAARLGDMTAHGGSIILGCFTVLIDEGAGGGGGGAPGAPGVGSGAAKEGAAGTFSFGAALNGASAISDPPGQAAALTNAAKAGLPFVARCPI